MTFSGRFAKVAVEARQGGDQSAEVAYAKDGKTQAVQERLGDAPDRRLA